MTLRVKLLYCVTTFSFFFSRFKTTFTLNTSLPCEESLDPRALLERRLASLSARNHQEMTHVGILANELNGGWWLNKEYQQTGASLCFLQLFLLVLRSLQLFCRLVLSLQPIPLKLPPAKVQTASVSV